MFNNKKKSEEKVLKSKEIIKKEKQKIKEEKLKQKEQKREKFYQTKFGKFFKPKKIDGEVFSFKEQILSMIYFEIIGAILCLLVLFALCGGQNYIKLYYELNKLIKVYDTIQSEYYGEVDKEALVDNAIESMIDTIDDSHTTYTNEEETNSFFENLDGTYEGIGCMVSMNENKEIVVASIFDDSPAEEAGLKEGDIIIKIDDEDFSNKTSDDMATYVKENSNQKIKVTIKRDNKEKNLTITRKKVELQSITSKVIEQNNKKIGYIDISIFSSVTYEQFEKNLKKVEEENIDGLVIDVRDDTGGYLSSVTDISSLFLKKGQVIYQLEDSEKIEKIKDKTKEYREYPIAILINGASASASEILASAIKESYGGIVVGTNSYGKGTVQKTNTLSDGSMIKYTTQNWLTPNGNWINEVGVEPTITVDFITTKDKTDNQLDTAVSAIIEELN